MTIEPVEARELRVNEIAQLFSTLDPFPFRERDLDKEAEEHIVSWAGELSVDKPIKIVIHLPDKEVHTKAAGELGEAFTGYFAYRADLSQHELNELFRVGRRSLSVGAMISGFLSRPCAVGGWVFDRGPTSAKLVSRRTSVSNSFRRRVIAAKPLDQRAALVPSNIWPIPPSSGGASPAHRYAYKQLLPCP